MIEPKQREEILSILKKKKIKKVYQESIFKYIELNIQLFPFLDIEELINRILKNFSKISLNISSIIYNDYGQYVPTTGEILLSPNLFIGKGKKYKESVLLHELDHCACAPITIKQKFTDYLNTVKKKHKIIYKIIPKFILSEIFLKIYYEGPISGICNFERRKGYTIQKISFGTNMENYLNEGITSFKQKIYSEQLEIDFHKNKDFHYGARRAAECISEVIGIENMIYYHFYNDFNTIQNMFFQKTNIKLQELIFKCINYDKNNSKKKLKKMNTFISEIHMKTQK